ncbi:MULTISPECIES: hypothetical protein [Halomonas]|uniref:hypothetical protein n=1 Tax=Halomonas TaxID=2745 RepID=UPI0018689785|nr:hypothetical protein [Halomonas citrativorans]
MNTVKPTTLVYLALGARQSKAFNDASKISYLQLGLHEIELMQFLCEAAAIVHEVFHELTTVEQFDGNLECSLAEPMGKWIMTFMVENHRLPEDEEITNASKALLLEKGVGVPATATDGQALDAIAKVMSGKQWGADTMGEIMLIVAQTGRAVHELEE